MYVCMCVGMDFQGGGGMDTNGGFHNNSNGGFNTGNYGSNTTTMMEASPASKPLRKNRDEQTLIPVTIRMILSGNSGPGGGGDDWCLMDGRELDKVQVVAAVRSVERLSTHYTFALEDGTGLLEVKVWSNNEGDSLAMSEIRERAAIENTYIRAIGKVKEYDGKVTMVADSVVSTHHNPNILTHHMLNVIYTGETYKHSNRIGPTTSGNTSTHNTTTPMFHSPAKSSLSLAGGTNSGLSSDIQEDLMNYFRQAHSTYSYNYQPSFYSLHRIYYFDSYTMLICF